MLVAPFGQGYQWSYGTYDYPFGGRGYYFQGVPINFTVKGNQK